MFESCRAHRSLPRLGRRFELADHPAVLVVRADEGDLAALWEGDPDLADVSGLDFLVHGKRPLDGEGVRSGTVVLQIDGQLSDRACPRGSPARRRSRFGQPRRCPCPSHPCARPGSDWGSSLPLPRPRRHRIQQPRPPARLRPGRSRSASCRNPYTLRPRGRIPLLGALRLQAPLLARSQRPGREPSS